MTDYLFSDDAMLPYSMAMVTVVAFPLAAIVLTLGMRSFAQSVAQTSE